MPLNHSSQFAELTDEQFILIGKIVVEWTNIEFLQKKILSRLLFTAEFTSRTYTDRMGASKIMEAIKEGVDLHRKRYNSRIISEDVLSEIEIISIKVDKARIYRNKFAHFCWSRITDEQIFGNNFSAALPDNKKHRKSFIVINTYDLENLYSESYELVTKSVELLEKLPEIDEGELLKRLYNQNLNNIRMS